MLVQHTPCSNSGNTRSKLNVGACAITQAISAGPWLRLQLSDSWVGAGPGLGSPPGFPSPVSLPIIWKLLVPPTLSHWQLGSPSQQLHTAAAITTSLLQSACTIEPMLYKVIDLYHQKTAGLFISSLRFRPDFAKTAVKVLHLHPAIHHAQGVEILQLCQGLQELSLQIVVNLPCDQNPLYEPLGALQLKTLSMDLASSFYGPTIFVPDLHLLCHIEHLHLTNTWVARHGLFISLQELHQLSHLSFHVHPPGQESIDTEIILEVLRQFSRLCVVILWWMEYQESQEIYNHLDKHDLTDHRIIVFNAMHFVECATPVNSFWGLAESIV
ncbi:hypothetical protein M404DRAFT_10220 [Pisolithus tinctorius Marx 270]|uniref:F-box domain-containing protein n=1 Tax=Pisolithus tinctorius Marx 270 TaxID=870435 RepID=A0A0C3JSK6_PISTI|nr:hypothetical protein M404DRAFT_10220 [Pisolithus tinctorius Marx 270]